MLATDPYKWKLGKIKTDCDYVCKQCGQVEANCEAQQIWKVPKTNYTTVTYCLYPYMYKIVMNDIKHGTRY